VADDIHLIKNSWVGAKKGGGMREGEGDGKERRGERIQ